MIGRQYIISILHEFFRSFVSLNGKRSHDVGLLAVKLGCLRNKKDLDFYKEMNFLDFLVSLTEIKP
jgi:hypothetical protein